MLVNELKRPRLGYHQMASKRISRGGRFQLWGDTNKRVWDTPAIGKAGISEDNLWWWAQEGLLQHSLVVDSESMPWINAGIGRSQLLGAARSCTLCCSISAHSKHWACSSYSTNPEYDKNMRFRSVECFCIPERCHLCWPQSNLALVWQSPTSLQLEPEALERCLGAGLLLDGGRCELGGRLPWKAQGKGGRSWAA